MNTDAPSAAKVDTGGIRTGGEPGPDVLRELWDLADRSLLLRAHELTRSFAPPSRWRGSAAAAACAGRLAFHAGAPKLGRRLTAAAYAKDPSDPWAAVMHGHEILRARGPWALWKWAGRVTLSPTATASDRAEILALRAGAATALRDFEAAADLLDEVATNGLAPAEIAVHRVNLLTAEDRYAEACETALRALRDAPSNRRLAIATAELLMLLGRAAEALDVIAEAERLTESASVSLHRGALLLAREQHAEAEACVDRAESRSPWIERDPKRSLDVMRAECAYRRGDFERARALLAADERPFVVAFRERLADPSKHCRKKLDVPFVRQHDRTCAPATLAALSRYWGRADEHLVIASAICYDGTPDHRERAWGDENGWITREFRVTWDAAKALIDRGVPFVLSTYSATSGHAQAVIGYDVLSGTILVRDPFTFADVEMMAEALFTDQAPTGPRGLALVPEASAALLEGLDLPDAPLYDRLHRVQRQLAAHDRAGAAATLELLRAEAPDHALVNAGRRAIAVYDQDRAELLACAEEALRRFPTADSAAVEALAVMRDTAPRAARLARLEALVKERHDPVFLELLANELRADAREHPRAIRLAERAMRVGQPRASSHGLLATLCWERGGRDEALELLRFAACLRDRDEGSARTYAGAARVLGKVEDALRFVRHRAALHGGRSHEPILTLASTLDLLDRTAESLTVLEEALAARPDDAELALAATSAFANAGQIARARELLARVEGKVANAAWSRAAAALSLYDASPVEQLAAWRRVLELEPLAVDAHELVAWLLTALHSREEGQRHLAAAHERFPHSLPIAHLWLASLANGEPALRGSELEKHIAADPQDPWALRELALHLGEQRRFDEALARCAEARALSPQAASEPMIRGQIRALQGETGAARAAFEEALALEPDAQPAIRNLLVLASTREQRDADIERVARALKERSASGAGLFAWYEGARPLADPARLDALIDDLLAARPELAATWSIAAQNHLARERFDQALDVARRAVDRFPLSAAAWSHLAEVASARGDADEELRARRSAHETNPRDAGAGRALALCLERAGRGSEARAVLERMAAREPRDVSIALLLASLEWSADARDAAIARVRTTLRHAPTSIDALGLLGAFCRELGDPEGALRLARENVEAHPESPGLRVVLAELLLRASRIAEAHEELTRAYAQDPYSERVRDLAALALAAEGRFDEAERACLPLPGEREVPVALLGRAAAVRAERGDMDGAIAAMRAAVARSPGYAWGWGKLADWFEERRDHAAQVEACRELVRISPDDAAAHSALGWARLSLGDRPGARRSLERALTLANEDPAPARNLFDLQIEDGDLAGAERSLRLVRRNAPDLAHLLEVEIALAKDDADRAITSFRLLGASANAHPGLVLAARRRLVWAGHATRVRREMQALCAGPSVNPAIAATWARVSLQRGDGAFDELLATRTAADGGARHAALSRMQHHVSERRRLGLLAFLIRRRRFLLGHPDLWSGAAGALLACKLPWTAAIWLTGCPLHAANSPRSLLHLASTLRAVAKPWRAVELHRRALRPTAGADPSEAAALTEHRVWMALEHALSGEDARAATLLRSVKEDDFPLGTGTAFALAHRVLGLRGESAAARPVTFRAMERELDRLCGNLGRAEGWSGRAWERRVRRRIARDVPGASAWLFGYSQLVVMGVVLLVPATLAVLIAPLRWWIASAVALFFVAPRAWQHLWPPSFDFARPAPERLPAPAEPPQLGGAPAPTERQP